MPGGQAAQQLGGPQGSGPPPGGGLGVAAAQQLAAVAAGGDRRRGHRVRAAHVLERGQHPVRDEYRRTEPAEDVDLRARRGGRRDGVLDSQPASDLGGDHHVRVVVEPVRLRQHRNAGRDQRRGDEPAVLAPGEAEFHGLPGLAQRRDRRDERGGDVAARPAGLACELAESPIVVSVPDSACRVVDGGSADTPAKGVTEPSGKPVLSRAQASSGSWSDRRPAADAAQVARSETMTAPGTSATYTGSTRVSEVRAHTGARPLPGVGDPAQIVPARDPAGGSAASPGTPPPQRSSAARPSGDRQVTAAGPGPAAPSGRRPAPGRSAPRIPPASRR